MDEQKWFAETTHVREQGGRLIGTAYSYEDANAIAHEHNKLLASRTPDVEKAAGAAPLPFSDWWTSQGKFIDPDTEDVPWFDKRKDLCEAAYDAGQSSVKFAQAYAVPAPSVASGQRNAQEESGEDRELRILKAKDAPVRVEGRGVVKNRDTKESREFWDHVEAISAQAAPVRGQESVKPPGAAKEEKA